LPSFQYNKYPVSLLLQKLNHFAQKPGEAQTRQPLLVEQKSDVQLFSGQEKPTAPEQIMTPKPTDDEGNKIGRNDPCYCGSGKKYKKCHGA
jgi:preprotein translocase subunit SecA